MKLNLLTKLIGGFMIVVAIQIGLGTFSLAQMDEISDKGQYIGTSVVPSISVIDDIVLEIGAYRRLQLQHTLTWTTEQMAEREKQMAESDARLAQLFADYEPLVTDAQDQAHLDQIKVLWATYKSQSEGFLGFSRNNQTEEAVTVLNAEAKVAFDQLTATGLEWANYNDQLGDQALDAAGTAYATAQRLAIGIMIAAVLVGAGLGVLLARSISGAAKQMAAAADGISRGELDHTLMVKSRDEMGEMAAAFARMIEYLQSMAKATEQIAEESLHRDERGVVSVFFVFGLLALVLLFGVLFDTAKQTTRKVEWGSDCGGSAWLHC